MGTILNITSNASMFVKPNIVDISILVKEIGQTSKEVTTKINENRQLIKDYILRKSSYKDDSYHQTGFNIDKRTKRLLYYQNNSGQKISSEEYNKLSTLDAHNYKQVVEDQFLYYEASLHITLTLKFNDTVVEDLVSIFNMCTEKDFICRYNHTISNDLYIKSMQELYSKCINDGVDNAKSIVANLNFTNSTEIKLLNISEHNISNARYSKSMATMDMCCESNVYEPENIIMPELVEELFNNNIELTKSLDLQIEF